MASSSTGHGRRTDRCDDRPDHLDMLATIADVCAAADRTPDPRQRAQLVELADSLLLLRMLEWSVAGLAALLCRMRLDSARTGGEDDRRDAAAA